MSVYDDHLKAHKEALIEQGRAEVLLRVKETIKRLKIIIPNLWWDDIEREFGWVDGKE
jgi:hypothetical protein